LLQGKIKWERMFIQGRHGDSDVSIISNKFINGTERKIDVGNCKLRYPTGENVSIKFKIDTEIELGKLFIKIPMFVSEISNDCLLGVDFLRRINLNNIFNSVFGESNVSKQVARVGEFIERVSFSLKELFVNNSKNLDEEQREIFIDFLEEFQDVFSKEVIARNCDVVEHVINLKDSLPIKQVPRRIPFQMREEVNKIIEDMRKRGVIEESQSIWMSSAVLVKKKDGTIRFCVDYRKLNSKTVKDSFPLPRIDGILDQLSDNTWFSTIDLKSGYWQIKINSKDKEKTAFSIGNSL